MFRSYFYLLSLRYYLKKIKSHAKNFSKGGKYARFTD